MESLSDRHNRWRGHPRAPTSQGCIVAAIAGAKQTASQEQQRNRRIPAWCEGLTVDASGFRVDAATLAAARCFPLPRGPTAASTPSRAPRPPSVDGHRRRRALPPTCEECFRPR